MCGTDRGYAATCLRDGGISCYAMSGTDIGYAATRIYALAAELVHLLQVSVTLSLSRDQTVLPRDQTVLSRDQTILSRDQIILSRDHVT
eukprot:3941528-Rhodomonas_salina.3